MPCKVTQNFRVSSAPNSILAGTPPKAPWGCLKCYPDHLDVTRGGDRGKEKDRGRAGVYREREEYGKNEGNGTSLEGSEG